MRINVSKWYPSREAAALLEVAEDTVKNYCRAGSVEAKQVGPKKRWHVKGASIVKKRKEWEMDDLAG